MKKNDKVARRRGRPRSARITGWNPHTFRLLREQQGFSVETLAEIVEVSPGLIYKLQSTAHPSVELAKSLATVLNVSVDALSRRAIVTPAKREKKPQEGKP